MLEVVSNMLDPVVTRAELSIEYPLLQERAKRAGWEVTLDMDQLKLKVQLIHKRTGQLYILQGDLDEYKAIPPAWEFVDPETSEKGTVAAYPEPPNPAPGGSAVFIIAGPQGCVICLPCNRLAYGDHKGPHTNWTLANWMQETPRYLTLCEMVNRINIDLQASKGSWGLRKGQQS
jgi:hypothetical protein